MFRTPHFFDDEHSSTLLSKNYGFITKDNAEDKSSLLLNRLLSLIPNDWKYEMKSDVSDLCNDKELLRLFQKDAERTYVDLSNDIPNSHIGTQLEEDNSSNNNNNKAPVVMTEECTLHYTEDIAKKKESETLSRKQRTIQRQNIHAATLRLVVSNTGDYHQGIGYLVSFLGILIEPSDIARIIIYLDSSSRHSKGFFKGSPVNFLADCNLFSLLLNEFDKTLSNHLEKMHLPPVVFLTKWFVAIGVHALPFRTLFKYVEYYMEMGYPFLFQFYFKYLDSLRMDLLHAGSVSAVNRILRVEDETQWEYPPVILRKGYPPDFFDLILEESLKFPVHRWVPEGKQNLQDLRELLQKQVEASQREKEEIIRKMKEDESDDGIHFSDDD